MGWIGTIFLILGLWYTGKLRWWGPLLTCVGEAIWVFVSIVRSQLDILVLSLVFLLVSIKNSYHWYLNYLKARKERNTNVSS